MYTLDEMKQIRKDFGLSYKDIKEGCEGVSLSSIQKAFGGYIDNLRKETLERLSTLLRNRIVRRYSRPVWKERTFYVLILHQDLRQCTGQIITLMKWKR